MNKRVGILITWCATATVAVPTASHAIGTAARSAPPIEAVCSAIPEGLNLIIPHTGGVVATNADGAELLDAPIAAGPSIAMRGPDGTVWVEAMADGLFGVHRIAPGGPATLVAEGDVDLTGVGFVDGRPAAAIIDSNGASARPEDVDAFGAVIVDFGDDEQVDVKQAGAIEYFVLSVTVGADRLVEWAAVDLTEAFASYGLDGERLDDWQMPTAAAPYNAPPLFQWPVAAVDPDDPASATLSWVEGPDFDGATNQVTGGWSLVLAAATTGAESLRLDLGEPGMVLTHADFDGRFWIGSFADSDPPDGGQHLPDRILAVDTQSATPDVVDVGCPPGATGTIDRLGAPQPSVPASTTVPTTTAVPPSTTPGSCGEYGAAENDYPVRRCEVGAAVGGVQLMLIRRGFDIEPDGYFGPATDSAVRQFQSSAGLEVDGLVV